MWRGEDGGEIHGAYLPRRYPDAYARRGTPDPPATDRTFPERRSVAWTRPADHQPAKGTPDMTNLRLALAFASLFLLGTCLLLVGALVRGTVAAPLALF